MENLDTPPIKPIDLEYEEDLKSILVYLEGRRNLAYTNYKDIVKKFNITKTTTRKRLNRLIEKEYIIIKKYGRCKVITLTEKSINYLKVKT